MTALRCRRLLLIVALLMASGGACAEDSEPDSGTIDVRLTEVSSGGPGTATVVVNRADGSATEHAAEDAVGEVTFDVPAGAYDISIQSGSDEYACIPLDSGSTEVDVAGGETESLELTCQRFDDAAIAIVAELDSLGLCASAAGLLQLHNTGSAVTDQGSFVAVSCGSLHVSSATSAAYVDLTIELFRSACKQGLFPDLAFAREGAVLLDGDDPALTVAATALGWTAEKYCP